MMSDVDVEGRHYIIRWPSRLTFHFHAIYLERSNFGILNCDISLYLEM